MATDAAQFVECAIHALGDDAAIAQQGRWRFVDGAQRFSQRLIRCQRCMQTVEQGRAEPRCASSRSVGSVTEVARRPASSRGRTCRKAVRALIRSTSENWRRASRSGSQAASECRAIAAWRALAGAAIACRVRQPVAQQLTAHARASPARQRQRGRCVFAAQGLHQRQVALHRLRQARQLIGAFDLPAAHIRQRFTLVCSAERSIAAAAACAAFKAWTPNPASVATCSCSRSLRLPNSLSTCHGGRAVRAQRALAVQCQ